MDNHGFKSDYKSVIEQLLYGNCYKKNNFNLRYNLMHFERNYPIKFLFNQTNKLIFYSIRVIHTQINSNSLNPNLVTGLIGAIGSFIISIQKEPKNKTG